MLYIKPVEVDDDDDDDDDDRNWRDGMDEYYDEDGMPYYSIKDDSKKYGLG